MHTEIVKQIFKLPIAERVEIIEEVSRSVSRDLRKNGEQNGDRSELLQKRREAINRLRGVAAVAGKPTPTDEEAKED